MKRVGIRLVVGLILTCMTGCTTVVLEGGKAYMDDHAVTNVDVEFDRLWRAAKRQIERVGNVVDAREESGIIQGDVDGAAVTVVVTPLSDRTQRLRVTVRKNLLPDKEMAELVLSGILRRIN